MRNISFLGCIVILVCCAIPQQTHAIPPPDVIANIGSSFAQIFSLAVVFLSIGSSFIFQYAKKGGAFAKRKPIIAFVVAIGVISVALCAAYAVTEIQRVKAQEEYDLRVAGALQEEIGKHDTEVQETESDFFVANKELPLTITNEEFSQVPSDVFVLDAREDEEYEMGFYPGSTHIRFADILAGQWSVLPTDQVVYVMCWSGIRGSEVAQYLRGKGIVARSLEEGANGWVENGGRWEGEIAFSHVYGESRYSIVFSTDEVREFAGSGVLLVDTRSQKSDTKHIVDSILISSIYTPSTELENLLAQVPPNSRFITVCDDFVSCFDAKIVGIKLEKRGNIFLGRYASPWEY